MLLLLLSLFASAGAAEPKNQTLCRDSEKGVCISDSPLCYYNTYTGEQTCGGDRCANTTMCDDDLALQPFLCCCYNAPNQVPAIQHACSAGMMKQPALAPKESAKYQRCNYSLSNPDGGTSFNPSNECTDRWCLSYTFKNAEGQLVDVGTGTYRSCQTTIWAKYHQWHLKSVSVAHKIVTPMVTVWHDVKPAVDLDFHCSKISSLQKDGTMRGCIEMAYQREVTEENKLARLCCCSGKDYCNDFISWDEPAKPAEYFRSGAGTVRSSLLHIPTALVLVSAIFCATCPAV